MATRTARIAVNGPRCGPAFLKRIVSVVGHWADTSRVVVPLRFDSDPGKSLISVAQVHDAGGLLR